MKKALIFLIACTTMLCYNFSNVNTLFSVKAKESINDESEEINTDDYFLQVLCNGFILQDNYVKGRNPLNLEVNGNVIDNSTFDNNNLNGWKNYSTAGGQASLKAKDEAINLEISNCGENNNSIQLYYDGIKLYKNAKYRLEFDASSTIDRTIECRISSFGPYYLDKQFFISNELKKISVDFTMKEKNTSNARILFNLGNFNDEKLDLHTLKLDNIKLILLDKDGVEIEKVEKEDEKPIAINQVGYKPNQIKKAVFKKPTKSEKFRVVNDTTGKTVYEGSFEGSVYTKSAGENNYFGYFTDVTTPGTYRIEVDDLGSSYKFTIGEDIYDQAFKDIFKFFYFQRCGEELTEEYAGKWSHDKCHTSLARIYGTDKKIDVSGGWHDAGDYGRYMVAYGKTMADLLSAYSENKNLFGDDFNIPESGNGISDLLDEVKPQLDWMLKMQEEESGGVYHKVSCADFAGSVAPDKETNELIVCPISIAATANFAAVMAMAYDTFKDIDPNLAAKYINASEKAWEYLEKNPDGKSFVNPPGIYTGQYGDIFLDDEKYWAAAQLFKATGKDKYEEAFKKLYKIHGMLPGYDIGSPGYYGTVAYINSEKASKSLRQNLIKAMIDKADTLLSNIKLDGYDSYSKENYAWGSNMVMVDNGLLLYKAYEFTGESKYLEYAEEQINYCFGKNPMGISYVTGYGTYAAKNPHHRPSQVAKQAIPGMLVAGPNSLLGDSVAKNMLINNPPAKCYVDLQDAYSTNEVDIYWNSALIYLMSETVMK